MGYIVGVSSGAFTVTSQDEKLQLIGFFKKAQSSITKGVQFIQLDLESLAEFKEPGLEENLKKIADMGITFGVHSETAAFGIQMAELDSAILVDYKNGHKRLFEILEGSGKINSKYVLIHSSESTPFSMLWREFQPAYLCDFWGRPLNEFLGIDENKWLLDWCVDNTKDETSKDFFWTGIKGVQLSEILKELLERRKWNFKVENQGTPNPPPMPSDDFFKNKIREELKQDFLSFSISQSLHYGPERYAYYLIAKWMEYNNDPLWENMIEANIRFFAKYDGITPEEWKEKAGINKINSKWSIDDPKFRELDKLWVSSVSAKYIWGHFFQDLNPNRDEAIQDFKLKLKVKTGEKEHTMHFVLESPMAHGRGTEDWLRFANPLQMFYLVNEVNSKAGFEAMGLALDLEHMISIRVDPETVIDLLPEDGGKTIKVIHAGWPAPLAPAHLAIQLGSEQQVYLYKMYYKMRQKGFGKDPNEDAIILFERGGPETFLESVLAVREIVNALEKDIPPEKLGEHPEFFGVATGEIASTERQWEIIYSHSLDPLAGMMALSDETHGFLGKAAIDKGKSPEQWKKEELQ
jgi:hypothetical protein